MRYLSQKLISSFLAAAMILTLLPAQARAVSAANGGRNDGEEDWIPETPLYEDEDAEQFPDILVIEDVPFLEDEDGLRSDSPEDEPTDSDTLDDEDLGIEDPEDGAGFHSDEDDDWAALLAASYTSGDFTYTVSSGEATLTAFSGSTPDIVIPDTLDGYVVTKIGSSAFRNKPDINSVSLPAAITSIGSNAFYGCTSLRTINIPNSVKTISSNAFYNCSMLTEITIPASVTSISSGAFYNSASRIIFADGMTAIPANACYNATNLTEVMIPGTVTSIGSSAFRACTKLASVSLPAGITSLGNYTFYGCTSLDGIVLPSGLTSIGSYAFKGCTALSGITLPGALKTIGSEAFYNCSMLTEITIPAGVTSIGSSAFYNSASRIIFAGGMTAIPANACYSATNLTEVMIPGTVTSIGGSAFRACTKLASVSLPAGITSLGNYTFYGCTSLDGIVLPSGLTSIGSYAFKGCTALSGITLPGALKTIGSEAFYNCSMLTEITIPVSVTSISSSAFYNSASRIIFADGMTAIPANACYSATNLTEVVVPGTVTSIGDSAFRACTKLNGIVLPSGLTSIGSSAFKGCTALSGITLPGALKTIGSEAFYSCSMLTEITIPASVTSISSSAFYNSASRIIFADGMTAIPANACYSATNLTEVMIPVTVTSIGSSAFRACTKLASVSLPNSITSIGSNAFYGCSGLTTAILSQRLRSIETGAFYNCSALDEIVIPAGVTAIGKSAFYNSVKKIVFSDGMTAIPNYACSGATKLVEAVIPAGVTSIGVDAFYGCDSLERAPIPDGVAAIGDRAFYGCKSLEINLVPSITTIGTNAFYGCNFSGNCGDHLTWKLNLSANTLYIEGTGDMRFDGLPLWRDLQSYIHNVIFADGITSICDGAFSGCANLTSVVIPDTVVRIGADAFGGCTRIQRIELSKNLRSIGSGAFGGCTAVDTVIFCGSFPDIGENALPLSNYHGYYPKTASGWNNGAVSSYPNAQWSDWDDTLPVRDVVLVLDASGSMSGSRITALKQAVCSFADKVGGRITNTRVALISYTDTATVLMPFSTDIVRLKSRVNAMRAGGGTAYLNALNAADTLLQESAADVKSAILFSDGEPNDSQSAIQTRAAALRANYYMYTVGLSPNEKSRQILIGIAGSEKNYFGADSIDDLADLFVSISNTIGKENLTTVTMTRDGNTYNLREDLQEFEKGSAEAVNIAVGAYWGTSVPGKIRITQSGRTVAENSSGTFSDLVPGRSIDPIETVYVTLVDADGAIAAMIKTKLKVTVSASSRMDAGTTETAITVYENKHDSASRTDDYRLSKGAVISSGGVGYPTNEHGAARIPALTGGSVTVSKSGYVSRTITAEQLEESRKIYLQPVSGKGPVVSAVWIGNTDVRNQEYPVGMLSDSNTTLTAEVDWGGSSYGGIALTQDARSVSFTGNTLTTILKNNFDVSNTIYIVATDAAGRSTKKALKFESGSVSAVPDILDGAAFSISDKISITLPSSVKPDFFAGQKINVGISSIVPVTISAEDGKVYAAIGADLASYEKSDKWATSTETGNRAHILKNKTETFIKKFKDTGIFDTSGAASSWKKFKNFKTTYKNALRYPQGSFGFEADFTIVGFAEGYYDSQGNVTWLDGGMILNPSVSVNTNLPFSLGPVPMYFEASLSADIQAQLNIRFSEAAKKFTPNGEVSGTITLSGGVGFGVKKVLYGGGGVEGKLMPDWRIYFDAQDYFKLSASVNAYAKVGLLFFEYKHAWEPFYNEVWVEYPHANAAKSASLLELDSIYDASNYEVKNLSYLDSASAFTANQPSDDVSLMSSAPNRSYLTNSTIKTNIYRESTPQYAQLSDGTALAVWLDSASSDVNDIQLYYSRYDGAVWSAPAAVYRDGTMDYSPCLTVINDTPYLVWQNADKVFATTDSLDAIAPCFDISIARYNANTGFTVDTIANPGLDMIPVLCGDGTSLYAAWVHNAQNDWFGRSGANSILYSRYDGNGSWSAPVTAYSNLCSVNDLAADYNNGLRLAYVLDLEGNLSLYENGSRVTAGENQEDGPFYLNHKLYWNSNGSVICSEGEEQTGTGGVGDYQIVESGGQKVLVYTASDGLASVLNASFFNQETAQWSEPYALIDEGTFIGSFSAAMSNDGTLRVLYNGQSVVGDYTDEAPYGTARLSLVTLAPYCDLAMGELLYNADEYNAGSEMGFSFDLTNQGSQVIDHVTVRAEDANGSELSSVVVDDVIVPGQTITASTYFAVDAAATGQTVRITATPTEYSDINPGDNSRTAALSFEDLSVESAACGKLEDGRRSISANIVNRGYATRSNIIVELRKGALDGEAAGSFSIASLDPLSLETVSFVQAPDEDCVYYVVIKDSHDSFTANDSDFASASTAGIGFAEIDRVSNTAANLYLSNDTAGICIAAVYNSDGKLLASGAKAVEADAGDVTIAFKRFTLPEHYTVRVFLADQSYVPIYKPAALKR